MAMVFGVATSEMIERIQDAGYQLVNMDNIQGIKRVGSAREGEEVIGVFTDCELLDLLSMPENVSHCPVCGEDFHIEGAGVDVQGQIAKQECTCGVCGTVWEDVYRYDHPVIVLRGDE